MAVKGAAGDTGSLEGVGGNKNLEVVSGIESCVLKGFSNSSLD